MSDQALPAQRAALTGWGRTSPSVSGVSHVAAKSDVHAALADAGSRGLIARGLGRSYGDAAQNAGGAVLSLPSVSGLTVDEDGLATIGAGASLDDVLRSCVPQGWFIPVTPGTRQVTIGGLIAADVHGKNHHRSGSIGAHVRRMLLIGADGEERELHPSDELFWATIGGMGLTGIIWEADIQLLPVTSDRVLVDTVRASDLDDLFAALKAADRRTYSVAWLDVTASGKGFGRGVVTAGEHAGSAPSLDGSSRERAHAPANGSAAKATRRGPGIGIPLTPPLSALNPLTMRAFNEAWYRKAPSRREAEPQGYRTFFHPLDGVADWNLLYGPRGFIQYQCVVPEGATETIREVLEILQRGGAASFLSVLKRFGEGNPAPLSFPMPGWTITLDIPAGVDGLGALLRRCDELVASAGGRLYLAKDSRMSPDMLRSTYPRIGEWLAIRDAADPKRLFASDLARRLEI